MDSPYSFTPPGEWSLVTWQVIGEVSMVIKARINISAFSKIALTDRLVSGTDEVSVRRAVQGAIGP